MNKSAFLNLIQQVSNISDQQTEELEKVAATFPYCQTAHLLLAKSAYDKGSMLSTQRLRKASSYATNRQLLKRVIYTSPAPEPVFEPAVAEEAVHDTTLVRVSEQTQHTSQALPATEEIQPTTESVEEREATPLAVDEELAEAEAEEVLAEYTILEETEEAPSPEETVYSELSMLLTFNSLSSSSTDLLAISRSITMSEDVEAQEYTAYLQETEEALAEIEFDEAYNALETDSIEAIPEALASAPLVVQEFKAFTTEAFLDEETPVQQEQETSFEDAEVHYTYSEIDRLYMEDALGYWMGSSRMGEVLQLKDEYTRPRPHSFHPELILEYSKTHELEKAIQPTSNALSEQLDIIDQFLKLNPRLKTMVNVKLKPEPQEDLSLKSSKIKKGMASESLANIFLKQGKTKKAIKIYELLILKNPEKKAYFAEQIEKLQTIN
ncbi:hypothetical protein [Pontibacter ruber]|uniref:Tetratricopeptide repeat protein n=1 Tax=Pontibacter ruber TaxID=1343895 RepID=A0ABW5CSH7_9BACT|nr:hypothetical protein [Pontibacter ruber]